MIRWNRPMRSYRSSRLDMRCASCGGRFIDRGDVTAEVRMVDGQVHHPLCAPRATTTGHDSEAPSITGPDAQQGARVSQAPRLSNRTRSLPATTAEPGGSAG
jgi:hypothetical protein